MVSECKDEDLSKMFAALIKLRKHSVIIKRGELDKQIAECEAEKGALERKFTAGDDTVGIAYLNAVRNLADLNREREQLGKSISYAEVTCGPRTLREFADDALNEVVTVADSAVKVCKSADVSLKIKGKGKHEPLELPVRVPGMLTNVPQNVIFTAQWLSGPGDWGYHAYHNAICDPAHHKGPKCPFLHEEGKNYYIDKKGKKKFAITEKQFQILEQNNITASICSTMRERRPSGIFREDNSALRARNMHQVLAVIFALSVCYQITTDYYVEMQD